MTKYGWGSTPSKYSTFKYGVTTTTNLLWSMEVDWDDDDIFDGQNEAPYAYDFQSSRGRGYYIRPKADGFERMPIGEAVIRLYNDTGRYDPYNAAGALYGNLESGKKVQIKVKNGTAGDNYPVFTGILDEIIPYGRRGTVDLVVKGAWSFLQEADVRAAIQEDITADTAIGAILDYVNWPTIWGRDLEVGPDNIDYWWEPKVKAKGEIESLSESGMGFVFVARDGKLTYYSRHYDAVAVTILTENELLKDISISQPGKFTRNIVGIQAYPKVEQALQVIWTLNEIPSITGSGDSYEVWAYHTYEGKDVPAIDIVTPLANTDWTVNTQEDGGGVNITGDCTISFSDFAETSKTTITNNNANTGYLTLLQVRGKPIESPDVAEIVSEGEGYLTNPKAFNLDLAWLQDTNVAKDFSSFLGGFLLANPIFPKGFVVDRPTIQFALELFDNVTLTLATWGIDTDFRLSKIKHKWLNESGQLVRTEFQFEPTYNVGGGDYWRLGVDLLGTGTILGW